MYPGLEADCQNAVLRYRESVVEAQRQQFVARMCPAPPRASALRQQLSAMLVRAGLRLQGAHAMATGGLGTAAAQRGAIA